MLIFNIQYSENFKSFLCMCQLCLLYGPNIIVHHRFTLISSSVITLCLIVLSRQQLIRKYGSGVNPGLTIQSIFFMFKFKTTSKQDSFHVNLHLQYILYNSNNTNKLNTTYRVKWYTVLRA